MPDKPDPASPENSDEYDDGPFTSTEVKTIEISGPFKITLTTKYDSSHVPPSSTTASVEGDSVLGALQPIAEMILAKLHEIRRAQGSASV